MNNNPELPLDFFEDPANARSAESRLHLRQAFESASTPFQHVVTSYLFEEVVFHPETQAILDTKVHDVEPISQGHGRDYRIRDVLAMGRFGLRSFTGLTVPNQRLAAGVAESLLPEVPLLERPSARLAGLLQPGLARVPVQSAWDNPQYDRVVHSGKISVLDVLQDKGGRHMCGVSQKDQAAGQNSTFGAMRTFFAARNHAELQVMMRAAQ